MAYWVRSSAAIRSKAAGEVYTPAALLQPNRPGLVNMRRVLYTVGAHPPEVS
jgi:hypothetical protein